ncbi:MAG: creatininase family protein [Spirochaetales bacterium]|nr:creatininase family protein [Spirochaetales bacterium]
MNKKEREIRFELLRPGQINREKERCPLVFLPVAPLEYHGPHLPVGMDPINATQCALETCRRFGKGIVHPTLFWGTERERPDWMLESLGFKKNEWIVGMDFPTAIWHSHYYPEHIFGLVMASTIEMLISGGYKAIVIVNGHGAWNQVETLERLSKWYSNTTDTLVVSRLAFVLDISEKNLAGHADIFETSLMMYFQKASYGSDDIVNIGELPEKSIPMHYKDFSVVDGGGFSGKPSPGKVVKTDPRDATPEKGRDIFEKTVDMYLELTKDVLAKKGIE